MSIPGSASPLFLASTAAAEAYDIPRSLRFTSGDSAYLSKNFAGSGTTKLTVSFWLKNGSAASGEEPLAWVLNFGQTSALTGAIQAYVNNTGSFEIFVRASTYGYVIATPKFRDFSAWRQIVFSIDTTESSAANQIKLWNNGEAVTSFSTQQAVTQNTTLAFGQNTRHTIGAIASSGGSLSYANMMLADFHAIDGQILAATDFGEYDDNNVWQPKAFGGTYGTNGFKLNFSDTSSNSALGTDSSGAGNNWSVNNLTAAAAATYGIDFDGNDKVVFPGTTFAGDLTIECFVKASSYSGIQRIFSADESTNSNEYTMLRANSGATGFYLGTGSYANYAGTTIPVNVWNHIALTRSGSTVSYYMNGTRLDTDTYSASVLCTSMVLAHGYGSEYFTGQISNARIVNGQALYTGASYTVPTGPLTTTSQGATALNVTHLLANTSTITANGGTGSAGTAGGNPSAVSASTFGTASDIDALRDSPVNGDSANDTGAGGELTGNYATLNPLLGSGTKSNGNLVTTTPNTYSPDVSTIAPSSGKWYAEIQWTSGTYARIGIQNATVTSSDFGGDAYGWRYESNSGTLTGPSTSTSGSTYSAGDIIGIAFDCDTGKLWVSKNNTWQNSGNPAAGTNASATNLPIGTPLAVAMATGTGASVFTANFGQRSWAYAAPTNFKALCTSNLSDPTIADGSTAFDTKLYTGNGSTQTVSGLNFSPDLVWIKCRSAAQFHGLMDTVRGVRKRLISNDTYAEFDEPNVTAFNSDGFTLGTEGSVNTNSASYAAWAWDAGSSTVSNTDGSITSQVRANASAGFSVATVTYGSNVNETYGHGLNAPPEFVISKNRDSASSWYCYHKALGKDQYIVLNDSAAKGSLANSWGTADPTSSVMGLRSGLSFGSGNSSVIYAFTSVEGYSAFGSYTGNGSADGPFVYTGFNVNFLLLKAATISGSWFIQDLKRGTTSILFAQLSNQETTLATAYTLSNGFKVNGGTSNYINGTGQTYIYAAFAEHPFKTARAR